MLTGECMRSKALAAPVLLRVRLFDAIWRKPLSYDDTMHSSTAPNTSLPHTVHKVGVFRQRARVLEWRTAVVQLDLKILACTNTRAFISIPYIKISTYIRYTQYDTLCYNSLAIRYHSKVTHEKQRS